MEIDRREIKLPDGRAPEVHVASEGLDTVLLFHHGTPGAWLADRLPTVRAHLLPDHGHLSLAVSSIGNILDDLAGAIARKER